MLREGGVGSGSQEFSFLRAHFSPVLREQVQHSEAEGGGGEGNKRNLPAAGLSSPRSAHGECAPDGRFSK